MLRHLIPETDVLFQDHTYIPRQGSVHPSCPFEHWQGRRKISHHQHRSNIDNHVSGPRGPFPLLHDKGGPRASDAHAHEGQAL